MSRRLTGSSKQVSIDRLRCFRSPSAPFLIRVARQFLWHWPSLTQTCHRFSLTAASLSYRTSLASFLLGNRAIFSRPRQSLTSSPVAAVVVTRQPSCVGCRKWRNIKTGNSVFVYTASKVTRPPFRGWIPMNTMTYPTQHQEQPQTSAAALEPSCPWLARSFRTDATSTTRTGDCIPTLLYGPCDMGYATEGSAVQHTMDIATAQCIHRVVSSKPLLYTMSMYIAIDKVEQ